MIHLKIGQNNKTQDLLNIFFDNKFVPTIIKPTKIAHNTATLIDNLYLKINSKKDIKSGLIFSDISDHLPIFLCIGKQITHPKPPKTMLNRQMNDNKLMQIKVALNQINWDDLNAMNTNESHDHFITKLTEIMDRIAPEKEIKLNRKHTIKKNG